ncbi:MAG: 6-bladed beta-propeller [Bacteroidales bacterium]|nr:6-bladed beta-propeller [Bacteroidales bacterium]
MYQKYLFFLVLFTFSCNSGNNVLYEFNPEVINKNEIKLSDIADEITYIPLNYQYPLGLCHKIEITDNSIYVSVSDIGIIAFSRNGQLYRKIGNIGRGPGEYRNGLKFAVDDKNERIYVLDQGIKIKVYSKSGNFIRDIPLQDYEVYFDDIDFYNSSLFLSEYIGIGKAVYNWIIIDTLGNLISHKKNSVPSFKSILIPGGGTYKFENRIFYWNCYNDTIFSISPDLTCKPSFLFSPGEHRLPRSQYYSEGKKLSDYMLLNNIFETRRFWVIVYYLKAKGAIVLIEKISNKSFYVDLETESIPWISFTNHGGILDDLDGGPKFQPFGYFEENGQEYIMGLLEPYILKTHVAGIEFKNSSTKYPRGKEELKKLADRLNETDNKILVIVKLKK